jgi:hypothetical protein
VDRLHLPEMIIIFVVFLFLFAPRWVPAMLQKMRPSHRTAARAGYPGWVVAVFGILLALTFIYGLVTTIELLR